MAYIQDLSILMRELLKVPKDCTPTAIEISKYIRSRYSNDRIDNVGKGSTGSRRFSSASRSAPPRAGQDDARKPQELRQQHQQQPLRLVNKHQKMSGRSITYSALLPKEKAKQQPVIRNPTSAKNHIRRAVSDLVVSNSAPKNKLAMLSEQIQMDPKMEQALAAKKKGILRDMVDPDITEREPLRTREIIQRLLEENKLEDQRREIARLTELARSTVMEARKRNFVSSKTRRRREERL